MSKSRFGALGAALKERKGSGSESPAKKPAKSKNPDYAQTTVYLHREEVYVPLQSKLSAERLEYSQLVENLLREWLKNRKRSNV
jgi:hypothetical protein